MVANLRTPQKTSFRPSFLDQTLTKQPIVVQNSYNANNIYVWNINILQQMTMVNIVCQTNHKCDDAVVIHFLVVGFTSQLKDGGMNILLTLRNIKS